MNCLRCGRETQDEHAFCDQCMESMKKYPVRPGTAVILPRHKETAAARKAKKHTPPNPKDQIKKLRKQRRRLFVLVLVLLLIVGGLAGFLIYDEFYKKEDLTPKPGQNYVVVETTALQ